MKLHDVIAQLKEDGWREARHAGAHAQFLHPEQPGLVTIAGRLDSDVFRLNGEAQAEGSRTQSYAILIECGPTSYGASVPDLPGCVAIGRTIAEVQRLIREAIQAHVTGLREEGLAVPAAQTIAAIVDVDG